MWAASLALTPLGVGCGPEGEDAAAVDIPPFVRCDRNIGDGRPIEIVPSGFERGGEPFVPQGINSYPLLEHVGRGRLAEVSDIFAQAKAMGRPIVRTNAFMDGGSNPGRIRDDDGSIREQGLVALDTLLGAARDADVQLLLLLTNNWSDYGGAEAVVRAVAPGEPLPKDAFWSDPRAIESQAAYIRALVTRRNTVNGRSYGSDATIFAWELANEARCTDAQYCEPDTLAAWARRMADDARAAGAQQPVAWGGSGYLDSYGERLAQIGDEGGVDILTVHIYPAALHPELSSESAAMRIHDAIELGARRIVAASDVALALDMPLLIEELGWAPPEAANRDEERAQVYRAWLALAHQRGLATMPWMIGEAGREDFDGYLIRPDDSATLDVIACK